MTEQIEVAVENDAVGAVGTVPALDRQIPGEIAERVDGDGFRAARGVETELDGERAGRVAERDAFERMEIVVAFNGDLACSRAPHPDRVGNDRPREYPV